MLIYDGLTLNDFLHMAERVLVTMEPGRVERHYQKCLMADLRQMGIPAAMEDPVPIYYKGECVWVGKADLVVGFCCIEFKAINKPPSHASRQLSDYIREKNRIRFLEKGDRPFWGVVVNFNPSSGKVDHIVLCEKGKANAVGTRKPFSSTVELAKGGAKSAAVEVDDVDSPFFNTLGQNFGHDRNHNAFMRYLTRFVECHLHKTRDSAQYIAMDDLVEQFELSCGAKVAGTERMLWLRRHLQKNYRVAWHRTGTHKIQVVYGGIGRGLVFV